jgi:hypothetical protein
MMDYIKKLGLNILCVSLWAGSAVPGYYLGTYNNKPQPVNLFMATFLGSLGPMVLFVGTTVFLFEGSWNVCIMNCNKVIEH